MRMHFSIHASKFDMEVKVTDFTFKAPFDISLNKLGAKSARGWTQFSLRMASDFLQTDLVLSLIKKINSTSI